jgi:group I intron endonuclease
MYKVYMHKNKLNGKVYIGITSKDDPNKRWLNGKGYNHSTLFKKAIKKYGWDSFEHIILFDNLNKVSACLIEIDLIFYYQKIQMSYNLNLGGEGSESMSSETKQKISQTLKNHPVSEETRAKISRKVSKHNNPNWGKPLSLETKALIGKANSGERNGMFNHKFTEEEIARRRLTNVKPILQYSKDGKFIREWISAQEVGRTLGVYSRSISKCCLGQRKTALGYVWKYK